MSGPRRPSAPGRQEPRRWDWRCRPRRVQRAADRDQSQLAWSRYADGHRFRPDPPDRRVTDPAAPLPPLAADLTAADPDVLASAVEGSDAVLSGLGPRNPRSEAGITSRGTKAIVTAMKASGARRLVIVSAAPIGTVPSPGHPNPPKHDP